MRDPRYKDPTADLAMVLLFVAFVLTLLGFAD